MKIKEKVLQHPAVNKILIVISTLFIITIIYIFFRSLTRVTRPPITVPIIPTVTPAGPTAPLETTNLLNPQQKLVFNWDKASVNIEPSIKEYSVTTPLINPSSVTLMANKLGFSATDTSPESDDNNYLWTNNSTSLVGSFSQNQIFFNTTSPLPPHSKTYSTEEAVNNAKNIISDLLGRTFTGTLETNPEVRFLNYVPTGADDEPSITTPEASTLIVVNFKQAINNYPVVSLSSKGEIISVAFDTTGKVFLIYVHGGYSGIREVKDSALYTYSDLQALAPNEAMRISQSQSIEAERFFTDARTINIAVSNVSLGYFQRSDNSLFPVFLIKGTMSAPGATPNPATYIVPAVKP